MLPGPAHHFADLRLSNLKASGPPGSNLALTVDVDSTPHLWMPASQTGPLIAHLEQSCQFTRSSSTTHHLGLCSFSKTGIRKQCENIHTWEHRALVRAPGGRRGPGRSPVPDGPGAGGQVAPLLPPLQASRQGCLAVGPLLWEWFYFPALEPALYCSLTTSLSFPASRGFLFPDWNKDTRTSDTKTKMSTPEKEKKQTAQQSVSPFEEGKNVYRHTCSCLACTRKNMKVEIGHSNTAQSQG